MKFKTIHIGSIIETAVNEKGVKLERICKFLQCEEEEVLAMYKSPNLDSHILLRWSKLLEYDFFRIFSQHLILYAPASSDEKKKAKSSLPKFRKNIYTKEIIDFILEQISSGEKSIKEVIQDYNIPRTTVYKWLDKYKEKV